MIRVYVLGETTLVFFKYKKGNRGLTFYVNHTESYSRFYIYLYLSIYISPQVEREIAFYLSLANTRHRFSHDKGSSFSKCIYITNNPKHSFFSRFSCKICLECIIQAILQQKQATFCALVVSLTLRSGRTFGPCQARSHPAFAFH